MDSKKIYYISLLLYILSLILPFHGKWLGGLGLMFLTGLWSLMILIQGQEIFKAENLFSSAVFLLLPFFNISYLLSIFRFHKQESLITPSTIMLFVSVVISSIFAIFIVANARWEMYLYLLWCCALILLMIAIVRRWQNA